MESVMTQPALYQVSEIELIYRSKVKISERPKITRSKDSANILMTSWSADKIDFIEQFKVILLNQASRVLGIVEIGTGGPTGVIADQKIIFAAAIKANATGIIISHNHPSGSIMPSEADEKQTQKIKQGCLILDIDLVDHIIISSDGYYSFADEGKL